MLQHCKRLVNNDCCGKAPWCGQLGTKTTCVNLNLFFSRIFDEWSNCLDFFHCEICTQMKCLGDSFLPSCFPRILAISPVRKSAFSAFGSCMGLWVSEKVPVMVAMTVRKTPIFWIEHSNWNLFVHFHLTWMDSWTETKSDLNDCIAPKNHDCIENLKNLPLCGHQQTKQSMLQILCLCIWA